MTGDLAAALGRHLASAAAGIVTIAFVARKLGVDGLGAWALLSGAIYLVSLSDLGLPAAIYREAAAGDADRARRTVGLSLLAVLVTAPLLGAAAAPFVLDLPSAPPALQRDLLLAAPIALVAAMMGALIAPYRAFVLIRGGLSALAVARIAGALTQLATLSLLLSLSASLRAPAAAICAGCAVELWLTARKARALDPLLPIWPARSHLRGAALALREGSAAFVINISVAAGLRLDVFLLARFAPLSTVAAYGIASRAVDQCLVLAKQTSSSLLHRLGDASQRDRAVLLGTAILGALVASGMPALVLDGGPLLAAWAGPAARQQAAMIALSLLGGAAVITSAGEMPSAAIMIAGRSVWEAARIVAAGCALNVAISVAGVSRFGAWAVAGGTIVGNAVVAVLIWRRALSGFSWPTALVARALAPLCAAGATALCAGFLLRGLAETGALASLGACAATTLLGCGAAALVVVRDPRRAAVEVS